MTELAGRAVLDADVRVCVGDPAEVILRAAEEERINLIVMPTRGYGPFRRFLLGSVTAKFCMTRGARVFTGKHVAGVESRSPTPDQRVACAVDLGT
jgi:hypothetical protein